MKLSIRASGSVPRTCYDDVSGLHIYVVHVSLLGCVSYLNKIWVSPQLQWAIKVVLQCPRTCNNLAIPDHYKATVTLRHYINNSGQNAAVIRYHIQPE